MKTVDRNGPWVRILPLPPFLKGIVMKKFGIVVECSEGGFSILLDNKIRARTKKEAIRRVQENPPDFIPEFMYFERFKIVSKQEIKEHYQKWGCSSAR